jgi:hypothetical protein
MVSRIQRVIREFIGETAIPPFAPQDARFESDYFVLDGGEGICRERAEPL